MDFNENKEQSTQYYSGGQFSQDMNFAGNAPVKKKIPSWAKALLIIALIIVCLALVTAGCSIILNDDNPNEVTTNFGHDYIGILYVQDTIDEYSSGLYNHQYILNAIEAMIEDEENKGIVLYVDTPGGSVFASDELYLKIKEYQTKTQRPVYASMQGTAASGGYYISAPCDKIFANRNCWTGSIGVTMGTFIDVSGLLEKLGVKTETITSGDNKAMGSNTEPMTKEQRAIFQGLIDEAYDQFVSIVAEGRNMSVENVKKLADGRIYTAKQAEANGLIDKVGTFEEAVADMKKGYNLGDCKLEHFESDPGEDFYDLLLTAMKNDNSVSTDPELIERLISMNGTFRVSYMSNISK